MYLVLFYFKANLFETFVLAFCGVCYKTIKKNKVKCSCNVCSAVFHGTFVNVTVKDAAFLQQENKVWKGDGCQGVRRRNMALEPAAIDGQLTLNDIVTILNDMRDENRKMEISLGKSISYCQKSIKDVIKRQDSQENLLKDYKDKIENCETEDKELKLKTEALGNRLMEAERYSGSNYFEVHGIPHSQTENVEDIVVSVGKALGCEINKNMIDACHRFQFKKNGSEPSPIVVKFIKRNIKEDLMKGREGK